MLCSILIAFVASKHNSEEKNDMNLILELPEAAFLSKTNVEETADLQSTINMLSRLQKLTPSNQNLLERTQKEIQKKFQNQERNERRIQFSITKLDQELKKLNKIKNKTEEESNKIIELQTKRTKIKALYDLNFRNELAELQKVNITETLSDEILKRRNQLVLKVKQRESREKSKQTEINMKEKMIQKQYIEAKEKAFKSKDPVDEKNLKALKKKLDTAQLELKEKSKMVIAEAEYMKSEGILPKRLEKLQNTSQELIADMKTKINERESKENGKLQTALDIYNKLNLLEEKSPEQEYQLQEATDNLTKIYSVQSHRLRRRIRNLSSQNLTINQQEKLKRFKNRLNEIKIHQKNMKAIDESNYYNLHRKIERLKAKRIEQGSLSESDDVELEEEEAKMHEYEARKMKNIEHEIKKMQENIKKHGSSTQSLEKLDKKKSELDQLKKNKVESDIKDSQKKYEAEKIIMNNKNKKNLSSDELDQYKKAKNLMERKERKKLQILEKEYDSLKSSTSSKNIARRKEILYELTNFRSKQQEAKLRKRNKLQTLQEELKKLNKINQTIDNHSFYLQKIDIHQKITNIRINIIRRKIKTIVELKQKMAKYGKLEEEELKKQNQTREFICSLTTTTNKKIHQKETLIKNLTETKNNLLLQESVDSNLTTILDAIRERIDYENQVLLFYIQMKHILLMGEIKINGTSKSIEKDLRETKMKTQKVEDKIVSQKGKKYYTLIPFPCINNSNKAMTLLYQFDKTQKTFLNNIKKEKKEIVKLFYEMIPGIMQTDIDNYYNGTVNKLDEILKSLKEIAELSIPKKVIDEKLQEKIRKLQKKVNV
ncbi:hypothetical protein TRFO_10336 [Tritrichomonas foetus]|uniref:Uncharacterized protein n=1 Tax=Tritrichomonas foetus TaxID=1144522 RepID=A0A1J4JEL1_9EUKA|nr:hypothetical protein TRFO_10336 [Tritrichomonas foetus]|eukprot:OHS95700.1 hypothetical protein TRFO_10336 [Tritrichomonas foetus]